MKQNGVYQFLEASGVLENGSPADIEQARRTYWNQYKAQWRKRMRSETKSITISFTMHQFAIIARTATKQHTNPTNFVYRAALTFGKQHTMPVDAMTIGALREAVLLNFHAIKKLEEEGSITATTEQQLIQKLTAIETMIREIVTNPMLLEDAIRDAIHHDPEYKSKMYELLKMI